MVNKQDVVNMRNKMKESCDRKLEIILKILFEITDMTCPMCSFHLNGIITKYKKILEEVQRTCKNCGYNIDTSGRDACTLCVGDSTLPNWKSDKK